MAICNYNCTELPTHQQVTCGNWWFGGINSVGILDCDHTIADFTSQSDVQSAIDNGKLKLVEPVRGEIAEPSAVEGTNPNAGGFETILDSFDRTATWEDYNVQDNIDFYNALNDRDQFLILLHPKDDVITVVEQNVNFVARRVVPQNNKEKQHFLVDAKWEQRDEPQVYDRPGGIFDQ